MFEKGAPSLEIKSQVFVLCFTFHSLPAFSCSGIYCSCFRPHKYLSISVLRPFHSSTFIFARYHFLCTSMKSHIFPSGSHSLSLTFLCLCQWTKEQIKEVERDVERGRRTGWVSYTGGIVFGMRTPWWYRAIGPGNRSPTSPKRAPANLYSAACVQSTCSPVQLQCLCGMTSPVITIVNMQCAVLQWGCVGLQKNRQKQKCAWKLFL